MARPSTIAAAAMIALGLASAAAAQSSATGSGTVEVSEQAGIQTTGEVIFRDIVITPSFTMSPVVSSSGSANVVVTGAGGDAVSLSVPQSFSVISAETQQTVTVVTTSGGSYAISGLQSLLSSGGQLSVDVGGAIHITPDQLQPGEYRGLLVVVAQYN